MSYRSIALAALTVTLLAACTSAPNVPGAASITLTGASTLKINAAAQLTAVARDTAGNALTGKTVTYTSSAPNVVSVDASGKLTVKKLSIAPVTLTASVDGKSGTLNVTTYGLEVTGGTYNSVIAGKVGTTFLIKARGADGKAPSTPANVTVTGPAGFNGGQPLTQLSGPITTNSQQFVGVDYNVANSRDVAPVTGGYTATAAWGGETYTSAFNIDAADVLPVPTNAKVTLTQTSLTVSAELDAKVKMTQVVWRSGNANVGGWTRTTDPLGKYSVTFADSERVRSGTYETNLFAASFAYVDPKSGVTPSQINLSGVATGQQSF